MANFWDMAFTFVLEDLNEPLKPIRRTCAVAAAAPDTRQRKKRKRETAKRRPVSPEEPVGKVARWRFDPEKSPWWRLVRARGVRNEGTRAYNKFRKKFRLPLTTVEELVQEAQGVRAWKDKPAGAGFGKGHGRHPLLLKVLAALRYLAKGCDPETLEDAACISATCLGVFIPGFIKWLAETVYPREVRLPMGEHLAQSQRVFAKLGFPGAYCNTDGVHLHWEACPAKYQALHNGKEGYPTRAFNVSVLQSTEIIHVSESMPGAKNDQTQAVHDDLFTGLRNGSIAGNERFNLYAVDGPSVQRRGVYAIVDAGYHEWRILQCPLAAAAGEDAALWTERLESVRKAVERTFGSLKKRFRLLRNPFDCTKASAIECAFKACCAFHNMLLRIDEFDTMGHLSTDWCTHKQLAPRADEWEQRCKHVVRGPRNRSACNSQREPGHAALREDLITHFGHAEKLGQNAWLRMAHDARPAGTWQQAEMGLWDSDGDAEQEDPDEPNFASDPEDDVDDL